MINDLWYKNAVVYCLSVATYMDANGDGIGDFKGLVRRLDYLQGMGITARAMEQQDCVISVAGCILVRLAQSEIVELQLRD